MPRSRWGTELRAFVLSLAAVIVAAPAFGQEIPAPIAIDPAADAAHPAAMAPFQIMSHGAALNAVFYLAAGAGPHPTMLLLHGFPGNEQNLDLAQAVRRAGWNVLTLHYRGSWGSPGAFSFTHCAEDAAAALAFLRTPEAAAKYAIDPTRIVVAGHSMGGMMSARVAADDRKVVGAVLIDPADLGDIGRHLADPTYRAAFLKNEVEGDMPPLAGTTEEALLAELAARLPALDLALAVQSLADRPLLILGATRGIGEMGMNAAAAARKAGGQHVEALMMPTDHSFSDHRIALEIAILRWLAQFQR